MDDKLVKLFNLLEEENINFFFANLSLIGKLGLYSNRNDNKIIVVDYTLKNNKILLTETLSEELGHHFTTLGDYSKVNTYTSLLNLNKSENKALKWATEFLISEDELYFLITNYESVEDMAAAAEVSVDFFMKRLEFLSLEKKTLNINGKTLVLDNLPMFYFTE